MCPHDHVPLLRIPIGPPEISFDCLVIPPTQTSFKDNSTWDEGTEDEGDVIDLQLIPAPLPNKQIPVQMDIDNHTSSGFFLVLSFLFEKCFPILSGAW